jgi:dTMP kinase
MIIAIEGIDASGKATQAKLLKDALPGAESFSFPNYESETGRLILRFLKGEVYVAEDVQREAHTNALVLQALMTANRYEMQSTLADWSRRAEVRILDRYWMSACAYGAAEGLDPDWLYALHVGLPMPDLCIYLDVSPESASTRRPQKRDAYEANLPLLHGARRHYLNFFTRRYPGPYRIVDGERDADEVHQEILLHVETTLKVPLDR